MPVRRTAGSASSMSLQPGTHAPGRGPLPEQRQDTHPPLPRASGSWAPPSSGSSPPRGFLPWEPQASREASCPCGLHRVGGGHQQQGGRADQLLLLSTENGRAGGEHARNSTPARISPPQAGDPSAPRGPDWPVRTPRCPFLMSRWGKQGTQRCALKASRTRKRGSPLDSSLRLRSRPPSLPYNNGLREKEF